MKGYLKYQLPPAIWVIVIYFLSAIPYIHSMFTTPAGTDKIVHALLYFILCWLVWRAFYHQHAFQQMRNNAFLGAFIFCVVYGLLEEYHHTFLPGRDPDILDVMADAGGALLFIAIASLVLRRQKEPEENTES